MFLCLEQGADCLHDGAADATAIKKPPLSLASLTSRLVLFFLVLAYPGCPEQRPLNGCSSSTSSLSEV